MIRFFRLIKANITSIWNSFHDMVELPENQEVGFFHWIGIKFCVMAIVGLIVLTHLQDFMEQWKEDRKAMFKECSICRDGYDIATLDYKMMSYFCPQCAKDVGDTGLALIEKFEEWAGKQKDTNGRGIGSLDVLGIVTSVFYAIKHKAPREPLFDALVKYTWGNVGDTLTLSELLEELTTLQENKLKPLPRKD